MDCVVFCKESLPAESSGEQDSDVEWEEFDQLFLEPKDSSDIQIFPVKTDLGIDDEINTPCSALRIEFGRSGDFYGRIVIYSLEVWGVEIHS